MTVKKNPIKKAPEEKDVSPEPSINDLKAQVYDLMAAIEQYQLEIQKIQQQANQINKLIADRLAAQHKVEATARL